jgi:hypothetical protein
MRLQRMASHGQVRFVGNAAIPYVDGQPEAAMLHLVLGRGPALTRPIHLHAPLRCVLCTYMDVPTPVGEVHRLEQTLGTSKAKELRVAVEGQPCASTSSRSPSARRPEHKQPSRSYAALGAAGLWTPAVKVGGRPKSRKSTGTTSMLRKVEVSRPPRMTTPMGA